MIESLPSVNAGALNIQGGWHHIGRKSKAQRAKSKAQGAKGKAQGAKGKAQGAKGKGLRAKGEGRRARRDFPFSIFYLSFFIWGRRLGVSRGSSVEIENDK